MSALLAGVVLLPLVAAVLCGTLPRRTHAAVALGTAGVVGALVIVLAVQVAAQGSQQVHVAGWRPPLGIALRADGLSAAFLAMTAVVAVLLTVYATGDSRTRGGTMFWALWLVLWSALNAVYLSGDLFNVYVCLELLTVAAVGLVALGGPPALAPALRYLVVAVLASLAYLLGTALVYAETGTLDLAGTADLVERSPSTAAALALMTLGLALKTALWPLHGWLPSAHSRAPAAVSPALSALVVKASLYVLVRLWTTSLPGVTTAGAAHLLGALGTIAVLWGGAAALRQDRLKLVVAYSTVAQVGYLFLVFPLALGSGTTDAAADGWTGVLTIGLAHGLAKAGMFMAAGALALSCGSDRLDALSGSAARSPVVTLTFALAGVSLAGLPPSLGFSGKWLALQSSVAQGQWWYALVLVAGGLLTAAYVGRVLRVTLATGPESPRHVDEVPRRMQAAGLLLAALAVAGGLRATEPLALLGSALEPAGRS